MAVVVGFAFLWLSVTPAGKLVFLRVVPSPPQRHASHDDNSRHGSKSAVGRSKRPPLAVKKQLIISPSLTLSKGWEFVLVVF